MPGNGLMEAGMRAAHPRAGKEKKLSPYFLLFYLPLSLDNMTVLSAAARLWTKIVATTTIRQTVR